MTTSGLEACKDVLRSIQRGELAARMVELMACEGGCINGPITWDRATTYIARQRVLEYASRSQSAPLPGRGDWPDLSRGFVQRQSAFSEEQIQSAPSGRQVQAGG